MTERDNFKKRYECQLQETNNASERPRSRTQGEDGREQGHKTHVVNSLAGKQICILAVHMLLEAICTE